MERSYKTVEPTIEGIAKLLLDKKVFAEIPCKVWLPRHAFERPFLTFKSRNQIHQTIQMKSHKYDLQLNIDGINNVLIGTITADEIFIEIFRIKHISNSEPPIITFQGIPKVLYEVCSFSKYEQNSTKTNLFIYLGKNHLLSPAQTISQYYSGNIKVEEIRNHKDNIGPHSDVKFDFHYYASNNELGFNWNSRLVAVLEIEIPAENISSSNKEIWIPIEDYLLLASFAADEWTPILGWQAYDGFALKRAWYGDVVLDVDDYLSTRKYNDELIDLSNFKEFMETAFKKLSTYDAENLELLKYAIQRILPRKNRTVQSSFLSFFSALESIVLIHRHNYKYDLIIADKKEMNKLEKALKNTIREHKEAFDSSKHLKYFEKNLSSLNRVPLADAFKSLIQEWNVDLSDLWPAFESTSGPTLYKIRNALIHGDTYKNDQMLALSYAMDNLEYIVKRLVLAALDWQIEKSNISQEVLLHRGWCANASIKEHMQILSDK